MSLRRKAAFSLNIHPKHGFASTLEPAHLRAGERRDSIMDFLGEGFRAESPTRDRHYDREEHHGETFKKQFHQMKFPTNTDPRGVSAIFVTSVSFC